jgi:YHS domain-containing protein
MMKQFFSLLTGLLLTGMAYTQEIKFNSKDGVAIKGYDPVAYFTQQKAVKGNDEFTLDWSGSKWKFSTKAHLDSFRLNPGKYTPQYGGFCAYGCSENHLAPTDPEAWTIIDQKLYLNYSLKTRVVWLKDTLTRIKNADQFWPVLNQ